jgi:hypothetical protein
VFTGVPLAKSSLVFVAAGSAQFAFNDILEPKRVISAVRWLPAWTSTFASLSTAITS